MTKYINRKLHSALELIKVQSIPINKAVLKELTSRLERDTLPFSELKIFLKSDPGLFAFLVRSSLEGDSTLRNQPLNAIKQLNKESLEDLLTQGNRPKTFKVGSIEQSQEALTKQAMVASTAAEVLAEELCLETDIALVTCFYRQLGLLQLAWCFPQQLEEAIQIVNDKKYTLDDAITSILGFSPESLAVEIMQLHNLGEEFIGKTTTLPEYAMNLHMTEESFLPTLIQISEALSHRENTAMYPEAEAEWQSAQTSLVNALGTDGLFSLERKIIRGLQSYTLSGLIPPSKDKAIHHGKSLAEKNRFLNRCIEGVNRNILACYDLIDSDVFSHKAMAFLTRTVLPSAFFENGALYLFDLETELLEPKYQIGKRGLEHFPTFNTAKVFDSPKPVLGAFFSQVAVLNSDTLSKKSNCNSISCAIRTGSTTGVLYLELQPKIHDQYGIDSLASFNAIVELTKHCLGKQRPGRSP